MTFAMVHKTLYLHLHHYFIGMLFWPATCHPSRLSMALQALLFGFFINGASRWGFDPLLEWGSHGGLPQSGPSWLNVTGVTDTTISLIWEAVNTTEPVYSITLNGLLAYIGTDTETILTKLPQNASLSLCVSSVFSGSVQTCTAFVNVTTGRTDYNASMY
eukprot:TRINITY_DN5826_c0_g1_i1.p1 TRINITY_DN5826_c0_g1~~TRINITY_DN5826_c0_g1_i1.p1  ORF type:complete len:160 (-),score=7.43 TRINITY_DN5826_c0_g1_i1:77-556(-)